MTQEFMTDVINWVGVGTGVVGALVVSPSAVVELVRGVVAGARRVLPRKRGESVVAFAEVAAGFATLATGSVLAGISEDAPTPTQVAQLVRVVNQLNQDLIKTQQNFRAEDGKLREEIGRIEQNLQRTDQDIRQLIAAAERQEARFNARGLPLIALSILMTGPANILAENAGVAWFFIVVAVISVIFAIWPWGARILHPAQRAPGTASG